MDQHGMNATMMALRNIADEGADLTRPLDMDFFVAAPDEEAARDIGNAVEELGEGFATVVEQDDDSGEWTCYCTIRIVPAFETVVAYEERLGEIAEPFGGFSDGFGTFGNAES